MATTMTTEAPPGDGDEPEPPRPRIPWWPFVVVGLVVAALIGAAMVQVPYFAISPGDALDVAPLVRVPKDRPYYAPKAGIYLTTVSLKRTTVLEAIEGWLDPTIDVVPDKQIAPKGDSTRETASLQDMADSKTKALAVAFQALGYQSMSGDGATAVVIDKDTPAASALHIGDTVTAVDDTPIRLHYDAVKVLGAHHPGDQVHLTVVPKQGAVRDVPVTLAARPDDKTKAFLGVVFQTRDFAFHFPYKVDIDSQGIGGPSAGLAFTLELIDVLTKGDLTGGQKVAVTGEIQLDGSVSPIGGVPQKVEAVKRAGVKLFLVPASEVDEARKHAGKSLRVEPVRDVQDALRILAGVGGNGLALDRPGTNGA